jgi:hypothetical protein
MALLRTSLEHQLLLGYFAENKEETIKWLNGKKFRPRDIRAKYANITDRIMPLNVGGLFKLIQELAVNTGIRTLGHRAKAGYGPRHGKPLTHSFRKIANTAFIKAGIKPVIVEKLLGHNIGLQAHYLRLSDEELLEEYLKSIDLLTVSQEEHLQKQVEKLQTQVADVDSMKSAYLRLKEENERQRRENERQAKQNQLLVAAILAKTPKEKQEAAARLREFHSGVVIDPIDDDHDDDDGKKTSRTSLYPSRQLELLDATGAIKIVDRPKILINNNKEKRKDFKNSSVKKERVMTLGSFIDPETGKRQYFADLADVPEYVKEVVFQIVDKKTKKILREEVRKWKRSSST